MGQHVGGVGGRRSRAHGGRDVHVMGEERGDGGLGVEVGVGHPAGVDRGHGHLMVVREVAVGSVGGDGGDPGCGASVDTAGVRESEEFLNSERRLLRHPAAVLAVVAGVVVVIVDQRLLLDAGGGHADSVLFLNLVHSGG